MPRLQTLAVHAGTRQPTPDYHPVVPPLNSSVAYTYDAMVDLDAVFADQAEGYVYARYGNPTVAAFEQAAAALEGAAAGVAYASGMAALHAALLAAGVRSGAAVVCAADIYGATYALLSRLLAEFGIQSIFVDINDMRTVRETVASLKPAAVLVETISNPLLKVADIPTLAEVAHAADAQLLVDNTFATPYLCQPLAWGADMVIHSATKYLAGHGDVMAGVVLCSPELVQKLRENQKLLGANLAPEPAWLAHRGLRTFWVRVREQFANAERVADWLVARDDIVQVHYPGLLTHHQHELARRLFGERGFGGMLSFELRDAGRDQVFGFMDELQLVLPATTLGDVFSLVLYPAHSSHRSMPAEMRAALGISEGLVRMSTGIEASEDIIADLAQALDKTRA